MEETEYKIITDEPTKIQTILNQWRHSYKVDVIQFNTISSHMCQLLVARTKY